MPAASTPHRADPQIILRDPLWTGFKATEAVNQPQDSSSLSGLNQGIVGGSQKTIPNSGYLYQEQAWSRIVRNASGVLMRGCNPITLFISMQTARALYHVPSGTGEEAVFTCLCIYLSLTIHCDVQRILASAIALYSSLPPST